MTRDPVVQPVTGSVAELPGPDAPGADGLADRICGRCRGRFEGDPTLDALVRNDWWLCPPCERAVFPKRAHAEANRASASGQADAP